MYIKYELYRSKYPDQIFNAEMIEWVLQTDEDIVELSERMTQVLNQHIMSLDEVQKFGTAYIGKMKLVGIEINDNDYVSELDEEHFRGYMHEVQPYLDIKWNKVKPEIKLEIPKQTTLF